MFNLILKKTDLDLNKRRADAFHQTLRLHRRRIGTAERTKSAEVPSLLVFDRRLPVRIQKEAFIERRAGNFFERLPIHDAASFFSAGSRLSMACSHVAMPRLC